MVQQVMKFAEGMHWELFLGFNLEAAKSTPDVRLEPRDDLLVDPVKKLHAYRQRCLSCGPVTDLR